MFKLTGQDLEIKNKFERIVVRQDSSFVRTIDLLLETNEEYSFYPIYFDSQLEKVSDIRLELKKGKKFKPDENFAIVEEDIELEYIASKKVKSVVLPPNSTVKISYKIECQELMYFTGIPFFSNYSIDTLNFDIEVPNKFHFAHNLVYRDSLNYFRIDSSKTNISSTWDIELEPKIIPPDPLSLFGIYRNKKMPLLRTIVVPSTYKGLERQFLNEWYTDKLSFKRGLSKEVLDEIDVLTEEVTDRHKLIDILYSYIKSNFKYVAIEVGMGAFIPTHANEVYEKKYGDCKDLSNLLSELLIYKGIKSNVALASTYDHITDCDFPSLSSANHVVCVAYLNDEIIILDPTDPIHLPGKPIQGIQERSILIINSDGGRWHKAMSFYPKKNLIQYEIQIDGQVDQNQMKGSFKTTYEGISGNFLRRDLLRETENFSKTSQDHFEFVFNNQKVENLEFNFNGDTIQFHGNLNLNGKIFDDTDERILFLDFLPRLFETQYRDELIEGAFFDGNFAKNVKLGIKMKESFEIFEPIEQIIELDKITLDLKIASPTQNLIEVEYEFVFDSQVIDGSNIDDINKILKSFNTVANDPIILKKKGS